MTVATTMVSDVIVQACPEDHPDAYLNKGKKPLEKEDITLPETMSVIHPSQGRWQLLIPCHGTHFNKVHNDQCDGHAASNGSSNLHRNK